jgi:hypothetical protein
MVGRAPADEVADAPILVELRLRLESVTDPVERTALTLRQGLYLARTDRLSEAEAMPVAVRAAWEGREAVRVFVWLWLLEGVVDFYRTSRTAGRTRLLQAHAAAVRTGQLAEAELAAAWLAHLAYVDGDYAAMLRWLRASRLGAALLEETAARSSLTLACALQWFGEEAPAGEWFGRAREVARRTGDRAGIMAATANRLMLRLNDDWLAFAFGEPLPHDLPSLRQELLGILGYERLSGSASLQEQNEVARLRLAVLSGDEAEALAAAGDMSSAHQRRSAPSLAMAGVVRAWLLGRRDAPAQAAARLGGVLQGFDAGELDDDDAAACWALMAQLARRADDAQQASRLEGLAHAARARCRQALDPLRPELLAVQAEALASWSTRAWP